MAERGQAQPPPHHYISKDMRQSVLSGYGFQFFRPPQCFRWRVGGPATYVMLG